MNGGAPRWPGGHIDWRTQIGRLGAALQDASPRGDGGHLAAMDAQVREDEQRRQLNAWAESAGLSPQDRMLLAINPALFFAMRRSGYTDHGTAGEGLE